MQPILLQLVFLCVCASYNDPLSSYEVKLHFLKTLCAFSHSYSIYQFFFIILGIFVLCIRHTQGTTGMNGLSATFAMLCVVFRRICV